MNRCWLTVLLLTMSWTVVAEDRALREVDSPARPGSAEPNLVTGADGHLYLSWIEKKDGEARLLFSKWSGEAWAPAREIARGAHWFVNWADFPSLTALADGTLVAHWLAKSGPGTYSYDVHLSLSRDGGKTWSASKKPHRDAVEAEHGFVSLVPLSRSELGIVWLDGREMVKATGAKREMTLRYTTFSSDGKLGPELVLDPRVCECCQTSATRLDNGDVLVVYRDRSEKEIRDIGLVRIRDGQVHSRRLLHDDGWEFAGCPVNGPRIISRGPHVVVAWFTLGRKGEPTVLVASSRDSGDTFGKPMRVDAGKPLGRVDLIFSKADAPDPVLVCWLEEKGEEAAWMGRRITAQGPQGAPFVLIPTSAARASGFPQLEFRSPAPVMTWTDTKSKRVRTATLAPASK